MIGPVLVIIWKLLKQGNINANDFIAIGTVNVRRAKLLVHFDNYSCLQIELCLIAPSCGDKWTIMNQIKSAHITEFRLVSESAWLNVGIRYCLFALVNGAKGQESGRRNMGLPVEGIAWNKKLRHLPGI